MGLIFRLGAYTTRIVSKPLVKFVMAGMSTKMNQDITVSGNKPALAKFFKMCGKFVSPELLTLLGKQTNHPTKQASHQQIDRKEHPTIQKRKRAH